MAFHRRVGAWVLAASFFGVPAACVFTAEHIPGPCKANESACDDGNPCTVDVCDADTGFCTNEAEDSLVPDDGNPCTEDECVSGTAQNTSVPDGTACGLDDQLSCEGGKCKCTTASECGVDEDCLKFACENETCQTVSVQEGTVIGGGGPGDCRQNACDGAGKIASVPDLMDFPADSAPGDCKKPACSADGAVTAVPDVTDTPSGDFAADCKKPACDPDGSVIDVEDPTDAPPDDGNPCTTEGCNGIDPVNYVPVADDTPCGDPASCSPNGSEYVQTTAETCQSGVCAPAVSASCGLYTCNGTACHVSCSGGAQCAAGASCQGGFCKTLTGLGDGCTVAGDCLSGFCTEGVCCNVACGGTCQSCTLPGQIGVCGSIPAGTDPDAECPGAEVCDGSGGCKKPTGAACANDGECLTGQCEDGVCCNADCPGDCKTCNQSGSMGTCQNIPSGQTSGGCGGASACNGAGACKKINGQPCATATECLSGFCPSESGQDVCCNVACNGVCTSCKGAYTGGTDGTCGNVTDKTDPNDDCVGSCDAGSGNNCCDGQGACKN